MRSQAFPRSEVVAPVAVDQAGYHLNRPCCDETGKKITPGRRVDVEGNDHWWFFTDVPTHQCALIEGGFPEPRIPELGRAGQVCDVCEDHLETVVVGQVVSRGQPKLGAVEVQRVPIPPRSLSSSITPPILPSMISQ